MSVLVVRPARIEPLEGLKEAVDFAEGNERASVCYRRASVVIGAVAGLWPALRAARMSPTEAPWSV